MFNASLRTIAENHLKAVAKKHGIRLRWTKTWDTSECDYITRTAFIPADMRQGANYLIALHEMGHLVSKSAQGWERHDRPGEILRVEAAAWAWAMNNALHGLLQAMTKGDRRRIGQCWASYIGDVW